METLPESMYLYLAIRIRISKNSNLEILFIVFPSNLVFYAELVEANAIWKFTKFKLSSKKPAVYVQNFISSVSLIAGNSSPLATRQVKISLIGIKCFSHKSFIYAKSLVSLMNLSHFHSLKSCSKHSLIVCELSSRHFANTEFDLINFLSILFFLTNLTYTGGNTSLTSIISLL